MAKELTKAEEILHRKPYTEEDTDRMFEQLMASSLYFKTEADKAVVRKAYNLAKDVYKGQKRRTGDSFIYHLFDVMSIVIQDIGLGKTGAVCALLHEITFQTGYSKDDITNIFDEKVAFIVESLAKIKGTSEYFKDSEPEVYKKIILGVASAWGRVKGLEDFIKLSHVIPDGWEIVLVGAISNKVERNNVVYVERTQNQLELAELYTAANVLVSLSRSETFGLTIAEAMACGTPAIVYDNTAQPELVTEETGAVVKQGDIEGIMKALENPERKGIYKLPLISINRTGYSRNGERLNNLNNDRQRRA